MLDAAAKALSQMISLPFRAVLLKSAGLALALIVLIGMPTLAPPAPKITCALTLNPPTGAPLTIQIASDDRPGDPPTPEEKARDMIERGRRKAEANPDDEFACNNLAWAYVTAPEALRDVKAAVPLAEKAVRLTSADERARHTLSVVNHRNTLGLVYYRAGRYREAVALLRTNLEASQNDKLLPYDLLFLAMSLHRLGEAERARDSYECAVRWIQSRGDFNDPQRQEITSFRAEAERLLGLTRSSN